MEEGIRREVAEEVGLTVLSVDYKASQHWSFPTSNLMIGCHAIVSGTECIILMKRQFPINIVFTLKIRKRSPRCGHFGTGGCALVYRRRSETFFECHQIQSTGNDVIR